MVAVPVERLVEDGAVSLALSPLPFLHLEPPALSGQLDAKGLD